MPKRRIQKSRAPRPIRRMGTEVHEDSRTQRRRERAQAEAAALREEIEAEYETINDLLDELESSEDAE